MFRYVLASASEHPSLAQGQAWPGLLSPREEEILAGLTFFPRRRKWLLGRVAAKRLVRQSPGMLDVPPASISVFNRASGEPFVVIEGQMEWGLPISISHRSELGLAATPIRSGVAIGADLETIEPRDLSLVRQFFTEREAALVAQAGPTADEVVARIWSAKEAVLKLLGLGLRLDTREIEVSLDGGTSAECPAGWRPVDVRLGPSLLSVLPPGSLRVVWRREAGVILTVAVASPRRAGA
jgi:phosphopantetheinyl transferase